MRAYSKIVLVQSTVPALIILLGAVLFTATLAPADELHRKYFEGLRSRGLFLIAEDYVVSRFSENRLLPDERASLTVELARTLTAHGEISSREERQELWREAKRLLTEFMAADTKNPRLLEVEAELAMLPAHFGNALAWEFKVNPVNQKSEAAAIQYFEIAVKNIEPLIQKIASNSTPPSQSDLIDGALNVTELRELKQQLEFRLAVSNFFLARSAHPGPNKAGRQISVGKKLDQLGRDRPESQWTLRAKLLRARLARIEEDFRKAASILRSLKNATVNDAFRDGVLAEEVRIQLDQGKIDDGLKLITDRVREGRPLSGEVRVVAVEGLLAAWKIAGEKGQTEFQKELLAEATRHHKQTFGKWQQRTDFKLRQVQQNLNLGSELANLLREAQWNYHQGELETAIQTFRNAAAVAHRQGKTDFAVEYAFTAGSIEIQQENWAAAAKTFAEITSNFPEHSKSSDASLMNCYSLGRIYLKQPSQQARVAYESALTKHRQQYAGTPSAVEATWMLATHQEQRLQWTDAIDLYRDIPRSHPRFDSATLRIVILYDKIISRLRDLNGPVDVWEDQLLEEIVRIEDHLPEENVLKSIEQCQTVLRVAQLLLQHRDRWYGVASHWLKRIDVTVDFQRTEASIRNSEIDPSWLQIDRAAAQLRIVSLAGQQRLGEARAIMLELGKTDPSTMLGILLGLTELTSKIDRQRQVELGHLQLEAITRLSQSRDQLTEQQQRMLDDSHAEAFIAIGNLPEAAEIYESLITKSPRSERLMRKVIAVLVKRGMREDLKRAREWWTKIERLHRSGTEEWIAARLEIAKIDIQLGNREQARKLLGVTKALYPNLGNPELKLEIEAVLAELK